ncbi:MAG TPA: glycosyl hydrolase 53 family protein, partial [Cellvibrio sp.]
MAILFCLLNHLALATDVSTPFYLGADLSYVNEMEDCGAKYYDKSKRQDPFKLFANKGANLIRVRLWHNPDWTQYSNLADATKTLQRAKAS